MRFTLALLLMMTVLAGQAHALPRERALKSPVIKAGQRALETSDVRPALIWVEPGDEDELRQAFSDTMNARKSGMAARRVAETYFLETLVRLHMRSQGLVFDGLNVIEPESQVALAAESALESGSEKALCAELEEIVSAGISARFNEALIKRRHMDNSVEAGREYVRAYLEYIRYMELLSSAAAGERTRRKGDGSQ